MGSLHGRRRFQGGHEPAIVYTRTIKGPLKYLLRPLLRENQFAVTQRTYACIEPNLDNVY